MDDQDNQGGVGNPDNPAQQAGTDAAALPPGAPAEDYLLQDLVELAEIGCEIGVTLYVGGGTICGQIVGGKRYFSDFLQTIEDNTEEPMTEALKKRFAPFLDLYEGAPSERPPPAYIHLLDARAWTAGGQAGPAAAWRGRISSVSGFSLGVWGPAEQAG